MSARPAAWRTALPYAAVAAGVATVAYGLSHGPQLGSDSAPFWVAFAPDLGWRLWAGGAALAAGAGIAVRLCGADVRPGAFAAASCLLALAMRLAANARGGAPAAWLRSFSEETLAQSDYLPALPAFRVGTGPFLDRFAEVSASLPVHPSAHPPGLLLVLHLAGIDTAAGMAALTIGAGVLVVPLTYALARELLEERRARWAALFAAFAPAALVYGASSADALFATVATVPALALFSSRSAVRAGGPPLVALASFFSYPLPATSAWALALVARWRGIRDGLMLALACAASLVVFYALLYAVSGFDILGTLDAAHGAYLRGIAAARPYWFWLLGSPTAFFVALGLPLAWLVLRGAAEGEAAALALVALVAVSALLGFTKAETERIWLFLLAPACVAAAAQLRGRPGAVLLALAAQTLAVQALLDTRY